MQDLCTTLRFLPYFHLFSMVIPSLRRAHQDNDRAVMAAYGFPIKTMTESQCVAELFKLYQQLTK